MLKGGLRWLIRKQERCGSDGVIDGVIRSNYGGWVCYQLVNTGNPLYAVATGILFVAMEISLKN